MLRYVPSILIFFSAFLVNQCDILPQAFRGYVDRVVDLLSLVLHIFCLNLFVLWVLKQCEVIGMKSPCSPSGCIRENLFVNVNP